MTKLLSVSVLTAAMAFAGAASAGPNSPSALATITPGGCNIGQHPALGTSFFARWTWSEGTVQTKFGGDLMCDVTVSTDGGATTTDLEVEFELERYVPGTPAEEVAGMFVYRCSNAETDASGSCAAGLLALRQAIYDAIAPTYGPEDIVRATCSSAMVKAMDPGEKPSRQNYPLVDVCDVEI